MHPTFKHLELYSYDALLQEAQLSPKPGLVDALNTGAHADMDLNTFHLSAQAIAPFMPRFAHLGYQHQHSPSEKMLPIIRSLGVECERAMFTATKGINTHKGAIFAFALLCTAMGYAHENEGKNTDIASIGKTVSAFCKNMVKNELDAATVDKTAGYLAYKNYGITGARGEAQSGFSSVISDGLQVYQSQLQQGVQVQLAQLQTLMHYIAHNNDTNLISRGGIDGLNYAKTLAQNYLKEGGVFLDESLKKLSQIDQLFIEKRLSPGGSADFLAITIFLNQLSRHDFEKNKSQANYDNVSSTQ